MDAFVNKVIEMAHIIHLHATHNPPYTRIPSILLLVNSSMRSAILIVEGSIFVHQAGCDVIKDPDSFIVKVRCRWIPGAVSPDKMGPFLFPLLLSFFLFFLFFAFLMNDLPFQESRAIE